MLLDSLFHKDDWCRALVFRGLLLCLLLSGGCASVKYTVDDGRPVDEKLLSAIRLYGQAEQTVRPAVIRSAALKDKSCDKQWELPFTVVSSQGWAAGASRVAWVRGLGVDERLSVVAAQPGSGLVSGDKLQELDGFQSQDALAMLDRLVSLRDGGQPFPVRTGAGKTVNVAPVEVCRGHVLIAPPNKPAAQDYHWETAVHPLGIFRQPLSPDEALWIVLWTQGMSEEGGARMKAYHFGKLTLRLISLATLVSGVGAAVQASQTAATGAAANAVAANAAGTLLAKEMVSQVGQNLAAQVLTLSAREALVREKDAALLSAANRSALSGIAWAAGTAFDKADKWALERMPVLGADPLAAFSLHRKLALQGDGMNAFVLDEERMAALKATPLSKERATQLANVLRGDPPEGRADVVAGLSVESMPSASDEPSSGMASDAIPLLMESFPPESHGGFLQNLAMTSGN